MRRQTSLLFGLAFLTVCFISAAEAQAKARKTEKVDCNKGDTIAAALSRLTAGEPNRVEVSGTCAENVLINGFNDLELVTLDGAVINDASNGTLPVININSSTLVTVEGFTINGPPVLQPQSFADGIILARSTRCRIVNNLIDGMPSGIGLVSSSNAALVNNTVLDASGNGVRVVLGSEASIFGIRIESATSTPGGIGLHLERSGIATLGPLGTSDTVIKGFATGVRVAGASSLDIRGVSPPTAIRIENNFFNGLLVEHDAHVRILGNTKITGNGANNPFAGGMMVQHASSVLLFPGNEISNNIGQGIIISNNATVDMRGGTVSNNQRNGIVVINSSTISFFGVATTTVTGNASQDLFCDSTSIITATSNVVGAANRMCVNQKTGRSDPLP